MGPRRDGVLSLDGGVGADEFDGIAVGRVCRVRSAIVIS